MAGLIVKLIVAPVGILLSWLLFPNVDFSAWYQPVILGVIAALIGYGMEVLMLRENTMTLSTIADFIVSAALVYFGSKFFVDTYVTVFGALLTAAVLAVTEIIQHYWLLRTGRAGEKHAVQR